MVISHTTFSGGVTNAGTIGPGGITVISSTFQSGGIRDIGVISGGISVDSHSEIVAAGGHTFTAIAVESTVTFAGGISNAGIISAANAGVFIAGVSTFSGNISNAGTISVQNVGIKLGAAASSSSPLLLVKSFIGNVINTGTISAEIGIQLYSGSINGGIVGNGTIVASDAGIEVLSADITSGIELGSQSKIIASTDDAVGVEVQGPRCWPAVSPIAARSPQATSASKSSVFLPFQAASAMPVRSLRQTATPSSCPALRSSPAASTTPASWRRTRLESESSPPTAFSAESATAA
jgi:hypothetical protein